MPPNSVPRSHVARPPYECWNRPLAALPELITIGRDSLRKSVGFQPERHGGAIEICYIERGNAAWWVGSEVYDVKGGDIFVTWPDELHGGIDNVLHPCKVYWIALRLSRRAPARFLGISGEEAGTIHRKLFQLRRHFTGSPALARSCDRMIAALNQKSPLRSTDARCALLTFLIDVIGFSERRVENTWSPEVRRAVALMQENISDTLPLSEIARRIGWSTSHLKRCFRQETGQAPAEYYLRFRVAGARDKIMRTRAPLTEIALDFGFNSSQYLSNCFRRITGRTPRSFRPDSADV
jgi:AraC-like DNA-binding protein